MTTQEISDREYAKMLATACFEVGIDKLPFAISSRQYEYFVEEWNKLNEMEE
jgi:hypothetical protein